MGQIQVLSFEVANLIAAGEVVDRPASAIKEMMENSIDAGAKHITVEIQNGGVTFMRVTDDGCGMSAEDLPMAIRRHATSKIQTAEDLDGILTLGFRGEALAAISSVSDMRIMSKQPEADMGNMLEIKGGQLVGVTERGCRDGTTIIVENLFSNVPARRKFLKRDATESMAVTANVERVALSHPEIAVRLITDGVTKLETAGDGQLKSAIWAVFGRDFAGRLIPLDGEHEGIRITGYIGRSDNVKANRNGQNFFINNRFVKSRTAQAALEQAFTSSLPPEKYPCCVM
ncbi:MAG: DNA mismatch repair endonuclease MutL, partial [Clostridia bacterium]|nr:DNA mismatch repair endonuclease MutL [Clostridia bacterium]